MYLSSNFSSSRFKKERRFDMENSLGMSFPKRRAVSTVNDGFVE